MSPAGGHPEEASGPAVDRAAAFAHVEPAVPRTFVVWALVAVTVLGLGGLLFEKIFSSAGLNPVPTASATTTTTVPAVAVPGAAGPALAAPLASFMGLSTLAGSPAPPFVLTDQSGQPVSLGDQGHTVVVLTFFNGACTDICPVLAAEIHQADADLGAAASDVEFLTVNTDPSALAVSGLSAAATQPDLRTLPNWEMLTGPLGQMDAVWKAYGVTITVVRRTGVEAHNDVMYFIDPAGRERYRATPFADESRSGISTLPAPSVTRWGTGIAAYARKLTAA